MGWTCLAVSSALSEGGGDTGNLFPKSDADDLRKGAQFIPGEVTDARRAGQKVRFDQSSSCPDSWYWEMPDGKKYLHS
jgi:hypothetical protein